MTDMEQYKNTYTKETEGPLRRSTVRDVNLDYDMPNLSRNQEEITNILSKNTNGEVKIINMIGQNHSTLFILSPSSMRHSEKINSLFNNSRFITEYTRVMVDEIDEDDDISNYISRLPMEKETMAIRRKAFKKLTRPVLCSIFYIILLSLFLLCVLYTIYQIVFV